MKLSDLQQHFFNALLNQENNFKNYVVDQGALNVEQRINIYQNAYKARLIESIETDHEILGYYLGDHLFDEMAQGYIKAQPSNNRSLRHFSNQLPEYLKITHPFKEHPVLSELARFERYLLDVFDAADAERATLEYLKLIPEHDWADMKFRLHPSAQLFTSEYNCVECWQALKANQPPPKPINQLHSWLIWRNHDQLTEFVSLEAMERQMLEMMLTGETFANICNELATVMAEDEVSLFSVQRLINWLDKGIVRSLITE
ncbi:DNA-binding domain-containing protein [Pleionea mediterranea]|uniref:Putative DNA-binding protein n=1 Tax=Pleionea mediterranea TaxID=523701 RepID=A0A316G602_9GAMM|nr:DNA-binding domain-containing protein [Pleionea mediterranea]PWK49857.1 putative DNA-binding protein [Pleionea mediterranea]